MMRNQLLWGAVAIAIGLSGAAIALYTLRPLDRPLSTPGSTLPETRLNSAAQELTAPPVMLKMGEADAARTVHLALGDDREANKALYDLVSSTIETRADLAINIIPTVTSQTQLYEAFTWAVAAGDTPKSQRSFVEGIMGTTGPITTQVLSVIAQNNGLDASVLMQRSDSAAVKQTMEQARDVLPPSLPSLFINGEWMAGTAITETALNEALGQAQASLEQQSTLLLVSDAYAFATPPKPTVAAMFMTLRNVGQAPLSIIGATSNVAGRIELHGHEQDANGVIQMRQVPSIDVAAGQTQTLKPAGLHLMLYDLPAPLVVGQRVPLTLQLQGGSEISTLVVVTPPGEVLTPSP